MHRLLDRATPLTQVFATVKKRWGDHQLSEFEVIVGLRRLFRDNFHRGLTYSRFSTFAEAELGIPEKLAWTFNSLGEHFERLPALADAVARGELTYTKAREFARFIDPEEQAEWIGYALTHTNREIERHVARYKAEKEGREYEEKRKISLRVTGRESQAIRAAREKAMKTLGGPVPMDRLVPILADSFLRGIERREDEYRNTGALRPSLPYAALSICPCCTNAWVPVPGRNMEIKVEEWVENLRAGAEFVNLLPDFFCDCEDMLHRRDECPYATARANADPAPSARSRYLAVLERKVIEARDGFRCRTPGCENPVPLENGHLGTPHRDGAPMERKYVGTQCNVCNRFEAEGKLVIMGEAPFEKYYHRDGVFLGFGFDPVPWRRLSHVGQKPRGGPAGDGPPPKPGSGRRDTG